MSDKLGNDYSFSSHRQWSSDLADAQVKHVPFLAPMPSVQAGQAFFEEASNQGFNDEHLEINNGDLRDQSDIYI